MRTSATIELVWTATAFAGLAVQAFLTAVAWRDLRFVYADRSNGAKLAVAWGSLQTGMGLMLVHGCFVTLGVRALLRPNQVFVWTSAVLIPIGLFMAASAILVIVGLNEARVRHKIKHA